MSRNYGKEPSTAVLTTSNDDAKGSSYDDEMSAGDLKVGQTPTLARLIACTQ